MGQAYSNPSIYLLGLKYAIQPTKKEVIEAAGHMLVYMLHIGK